LFTIWKLLFVDDLEKPALKFLLSHGPPPTSPNDAKQWKLPLFVPAYPISECGLVRSQESTRHFNEMRTRRIQRMAPCFLTVKCSKICALPLQ
jgi:hypothetical protein